MYKCIGHPQKADIGNIVNWALNEDFNTAYNNIQKLKTSEGEISGFPQYKLTCSLLQV